MSTAQDDVPPSPAWAFIEAAGMSTQDDVPPSPAWAFIEAEAAALSDQPIQPKQLVQDQRSKYGGRYCWVRGCHNNVARHCRLGIKFHKFPKNQERCLKWAQAVNRRLANGELWMPTPQSVVCSEHFVGGKSDDPNSPGYIPTVFPTHIVHRPQVTSNSTQGNAGLVKLKQDNRDVFLQNLMSEFKESLSYGNHDLVLSGCDAKTCKTTSSVACHQLAMAAHSPFMAEILCGLSHVEDVKIIVVGAEEKSIQDLSEAMYDPFSENQQELLSSLGLWSDSVPWNNYKEHFDFIDINESDSEAQSGIPAVKSEKNVAVPGDPICRVCSNKISDSDSNDVKEPPSPGSPRDDASVTLVQVDDEIKEEGSCSGEEEDEKTNVPSSKVSLKFSSEEFAAIGGKLRLKRDSEGRLVLGGIESMGAKVDQVKEDVSETNPKGNETGREGLKKIVLAPAKNQVLGKLSDTLPKKKVVVIKASPGTKLPLRSLMMKLKRRVDTENESAPVLEETLAVCELCMNVVTNNHQCHLSVVNLFKIKKASPNRISFNDKDEPVSVFFSSMVPLILDGKRLDDFCICSMCELIKPVSVVKSETFQHDCQSKNVKPSGDAQKGEKKFQCEECGKQYSKKNDLAKHITAEHRNERHMCDLCGTVLKTEWGLKSHVKVVHEAIREKTIPCETCGQLFRTPEVLRIHRMQHTGERPQKCEICGKGFIQVQCCKQHVKNAHGVIIPKGQNVKEFFKKYFEKKDKESKSDISKDPDSSSTIKKEASTPTMDVSGPQNIQDQDTESESHTPMDTSDGYW